MILEFVEDIFGKMIPSRFGGPVPTPQPRASLQYHSPEVLGRVELSMHQAFQPCGMLVHFYGMNTFECAHFSCKMFCAGLA